MASETRPWLLELAAVALLLGNMALAGLVEAGSGRGIAGLVGAMFAPGLLTLLVVGVVRLLKGARTRKGTAQVAVITLSVMVFGQCGNLGRQPRRAVSEDELQVKRVAAVAEIAAETSKTLPKRVDADTELFAVTAEGATLVYSYRLVNADASDVEPAALAAAVVESACSKPATRDRFLKQGIGMRHVYHDRNGATVIAVPITANECARVATGRPTTR